MAKVRLAFLGQIAGSEVNVCHLHRGWQLQQSRHAAERHDAQPRRQVGCC
jgi:hypothetical protein